MEPRRSRGERGCFDIPGGRPPVHLRSYHRRIVGRCQRDSRQRRQPHRCCPAAPARRHTCAREGTPQRQAIQDCQG